MEEETELLKHCDQRLKTLVLAGVDTGFRAGELRSLRWQAVDFKRGTVSVASYYTKNGDPRCNPMTKRLEQALREYKSAAGNRADGLVFGPQQWRKAFESAKKLAGLGKDVVFHSLRHTYISRSGHGGSGHSHRARIGRTQDDHNDDALRAPWARAKEAGGGQIRR